MVSTHRPASQNSDNSMDSHKLLLVVEDSDEDFNALLRTIDKLGTTLSVHRLADGDEALDYLQMVKSSLALQSISKGSRHKAGTPEPVATQPYVILLDLNLPGTDGREVLEEIKQDPILKMIPVVVFSSSTNQKDIESCYRLGANGYLLKPLGLDKLLNTVQTFINYWFQWSIVAQ